MAGLSDAFRAPYSFAPSEFTTPDEMRQERISQALGWDTTQPSARFRETLVRHLPAMLGFIGPRVSVAPRVAPTGPTPSPPSQQMRLNTETWSYEPVGPPQSRPGPTQGQRDLYELTPATNPHEARAMMMDDNHRSMLDPVRSQQFWNAPDLHSARPQSVPASNALQRGPTQPQRDFHAMEPGISAEVAFGRRASDPMQQRLYWEGLRKLENLPRPPNNRLNALLPFAGAGAGAGLSGAFQDWPR